MAVRVARLDTASSPCFDNSLGSVHGSIKLGLYCMRSRFMAMNGGMRLDVFAVSRMPFVKALTCSLDSILSLSNTIPPTRYLRTNSFCDSSNVVPSRPIHIN